MSRKEIHVTGGAFRDEQHERDYNERLLAKDKYGNYKTQSDPAYRKQMQTERDKIFGTEKYEEVIHFVENDHDIGRKAYLSRVAEKAVEMNIKTDAAQYAKKAPVAGSE